jgi:hypothetical protein
MTQPLFIDPEANQRWQAALLAIGAVPATTEEAEAADPDMLLVQRADRFISGATIIIVAAAIGAAFIIGLVIASVR